MVMVVIFVSVPFCQDLFSVLIIHVNRVSFFIVYSELTLSRGLWAMEAHISIESCTAIV